jgi:hypothetical protein
MFGGGLMVKGGISIQTGFGVWPVVCIILG